MEKRYIALADRNIPGHGVLETGVERSLPVELGEQLVRQNLVREADVRTMKEPARPRTRATEGETE